MIFINLVLVCFSTFLFDRAVSESPKFRILAPPFVCPKDKDAVIDKPDNTVVSLQTEPGLKVKFHWTVHWYPLVAPTQLFTLKLWRTVRELELKLNRPQLEPNVFVINNTELLSGVNYIFNITATSLDDDESTEKMFHIDNIKGDLKLLIEGRSDMISVVLIGGQTTFTDLEFTLDAHVIMCFKSNDYYFVWTVRSAGHEVNVSEVQGSRLVVQSNTLIPGLSYDILAQVFRYSNGDFITQSTLPIYVKHRHLKVNFNVDQTLVSIDTPFTIQTDMRKLDYFDDGLTVTWACTFDGISIDAFESVGDGKLSFPSGLPDLGEYVISVTIGLLGQNDTFKAHSRVFTVESSLPIIEVELIPRIVNENSVITLSANVSNMTPGCSISWYFTSDDCLTSSESTATGNCVENEHGTPISAPVNFYSLEENFLSELTDYSNETGSKPVVTEMVAAAGRARVAAECACSTTYNCTTEGTVYADVTFQINDKPTAGLVMVMPETGTAMETIFRLSTLALVDPYSPLRYSFYCKLSSNDTVILGSYLEHVSVETLLPYIDGGTDVWVEVCDSLGACSLGAPTLVPMSPGQARTVDALVDDARAYVRRCEIMMLRRLSASAVVTYTNAGQMDALTKYTSALLESLDRIDEHCIKLNYEEYYTFLRWLEKPE